MLEPLYARRLSDDITARVIASNAALLARMGVIVIDVPAAKLTTALIDEYLRVKRRGLL